MRPTPTIDPDGGPRRVAFYAPLKAPDDPTPSGDRTVARLLLAALRTGGHAVTVASRLRAAAREPDEVALDALRGRAGEEASRLVSAWGDPRDAMRPDVWFTYHSYYKSPDLVGPAVAAALGIAYVTAESSHASKRDRDAWRPWQQAAETSLRAADVLFALTERDARGLSAFRGSRERLVSLPPFLDTAPFRVAAPPRAPNAPLRLVTVAMMRPGVKIDSYAALAAALAGLGDVDWHLTIVGDGPARATVVQAFASLPPGRIDWAGLLPADGIRCELVRSDLCVWPGFGEAYGMAYLEAQAAGLPVVAFDAGGIASVVRGGETGLLVPEGDVRAYAAAIRSLLQDHARRRHMGEAARAFVLGERSLDQAATILTHGLDDACRRVRQRRDSRVGA